MTDEVNSLHNLYNYAISMINIGLSPGKYIVAVSGGVDSMVLLDVLSKLPGVELVVAHFDHGIRPDSAQDRLLVERVSKEYRLPFRYAEGHLGKSASEATARAARYDFLRKVQQEANARAIITAHHQDDRIETAILNLLRGTNRRGLSSLQSSDELIRPLLPYAKEELRKYADDHNIEWREDSTNQDDIYMRNYVRHNIVPALGPEKRNQLVSILETLGETNSEIDMALVSELGHLHEGRGLNRFAFIMLPHVLAKEYMALWLRQEGIRDYDKAMLERLVVAAKTAAPSRIFDITRGARMVVYKDYLALVHV
jgi:tRNA(Ile)-lysidine synthase